MTELPRVRVIGSWRRAFTIVVLCASVANISWNVAKMDDEDAFRSLQTKKDQLNQQIQLLNDKLNYPTPQPDYNLQWTLGYGNGECICKVDAKCGNKESHLNLHEDQIPRLDLRSYHEYPFALDANQPHACPPGHLAVSDLGRMVCE